MVLRGTRAKEGVGALLARQSSYQEEGLLKKTLLFLLICCISLATLAGCKKEADPTAEPDPTAPAIATQAASDTATLVVKEPVATAAAANPTATTAATNPTVATAASGPTATAGSASAPTKEAAMPTTTPVPADPTVPVGPPVAAAALVNGRPIPLGDYEAQVALATESFTKHAGASGADGAAALQQVRRQVLSWLVDQEIIEQAAERLHVVISDEMIDQEVAKVRDNDPAQFARWLQDNGLTEEGFREKLREELVGTEVRNAVTEYLPTHMEQVRLRHILLGSRSEAENVLKQIKSVDDFENLARLYSQDMGTRETGGDLGFYPRGVLSPEIDRVAFNLVLGQISDVIQTSYGYHIVQIMERSAQREVPEAMLLALRQQAFMDWLEAERGRTEIEYLID